MPDPSVSQDVEKVIDDALEVIRSMLHYPPNGVHYCRWCHQQTSGGGSHAEYCGYVSDCDNIDKVRRALPALSSLRDRVVQQEKELQALREKKKES